MMSNTPTRTLVANTALALTAVAVVALTPATAFAKSKTHKDDVRGFECKIEDSWEQVPPKPGTDDLHIAAEWKDPSPKYQRYSADQPTFRIIWTVTPKGDAKPAEDAPLPPWAKDLPPELQEQVRKMQSGTSQTLEGEVNERLEWLARLFGPYKPLAEHYAERKKPETIETRDDYEVDVVEINYHKKRPPETEPHWWMWVGRTGWETETEKIEVGFYGYVDLKFAKDFRKQFESTVRSFKLREIASDEEASDRFADAVREKDPPDVRKKIIDFLHSKLPKDWTYERTDNYLVVYDEDVDSKRIVDRVTTEIEALRKQVYEVLFPPDRPITAVSIVRVCDSREQYMGYGAPGGSAGYWSPYHEELVLYQDRNDKKDAIRVLYHEAFHQYIYYSVGEVSPHSWFNEGHGDFFSGHVLKGGRFKPEPFSWRTETAREAKRQWKDGIYRFRNPRRRGEQGTSDAPVEKERLTLKEWLTWRQPEYYGNNDFAYGEAVDGNPRPIPGGVNYALGWSFIYFLRETKNEQYQKILPSYFNTLKSFVTQDREARERALEEGFGGGQEGGDGEPGEPGEPGDPANPGGGSPDGGAPTPTADEPAASETSDTVSRGDWHGESLGEAMRGIDWDQLEKDWLDHSW